MNGLQNADNVVMRYVASTEITDNGIGQLISCQLVAHTSVAQKWHVNIIDAVIDIYADTVVQVGLDSTHLHASPTVVIFAEPCAVS
jgi:hypothetical protein